MAPRLPVGVELSDLHAYRLAGWSEAVNLAHAGITAAVAAFQAEFPFAPEGMTEDAYAALMARLRELPQDESAAARDHYLSLANAIRPDTVLTVVPPDAETTAAVGICQQAGWKAVGRHPELIGPYYDAGIELAISIAGEAGRGDFFVGYSEENRDFDVIVHPRELVEVWLSWGPWYLIGA